MWIRWRGRRARFAFQAWCIVAYLHVCPAFWIKRQLQETRTWHRPGADRVDFTGQKLLCCVFYVSWHVWECCARRHTHTHTHTHRGISVLSCDVFRCEAENGGERRQRRSGRSPADLHLCLDAESELSESRKKPASMRWRGSYCLLCGCMMKPDDSS